MSQKDVPPTRTTAATVADGPAEPELKPTKAAPVPPSPKPDMSMRGFVKELRRIHQNSESQSFVFLLGAGASVTSDIPGAEKLARDWLAELHEQDANHGIVPFDQWLDEKRHGIEGLDPKNIAASYPDIFDRRFASNPNLGYAFLTSLMKDAQPGYGYSVLATMLAESRHKAVVTTNFDSLVERALLYYTNHTPLTCTHETTAGAFHKGLSRPLIVKCHRDLLLDPHNGRRETNTLHDNFGKALESLLPGRVLIVVGYGGNDRSLMTFLKSLDPKYWPEAVYWCYWEPGGAPEAGIQAWVTKHNGRMVPIPGFDELMAGIAGEFEYEPLEAQMEAQHKERVRRYKEQAEKIARKGKAPDHPVAKAAIVGPGNDDTQIGTSSAFATWNLVSNRPINDGVNFASESIAKAVRSGKQHRTPWEALLTILAIADPDRQSEAFRASLTEFPNSALLLGSYASFLGYIRNDTNAAEAMYQRALKADPKHADTLGNYANFLTDIRKEHDAAEALFKRALEADPKHAINLGNYALFLKDIRKDYDAAEALFKRALEADPKQGDLLSNYAIFLTSIRKDHDAADALFRRALEIAPNAVATLGNYAIFLTSIRKDHDAAEAQFSRALATAPKHVAILGSYASFLTKIRKDPNAAEALYKRALQVAPKDAGALSNYAHFLTNIRMDHDAAEAFYRRGLESDPRNVRTLGNYAIFLTDIRKDYDAAEALYKRALETEPTNANNLGNYARLLLSASRSSEGLVLLERAIAALEPSSPTALDAECWMYAYCCRPTKDHPEALARLKHLVVKDAVRTGEWDFAGVITQANKMGHPESAWLPKLAAVLAGAESPASLDAWSAWASA